VIDIERLSMSDVVRSGNTLRSHPANEPDMMAVSGRIARYLFDEYRAVDGRPAFVLARLYKTHEFGGLPSDLQSFARALMPDETITEVTKCLTLLGTAGTQPEWESPQQSKGHRSIPLASVATVERLPMVAMLFRDLGLEIRSLLFESSQLLVDSDKQTYNVFYVADAAGSPFIPAQDFVLGHGVRSVVGFGGILPDGNLFAVILFASLALTRDQAQLFRPLALNVKLALLPVVSRTFP
jgi:hypothetical protein